MIKKDISLENLEEFSINLESHPLKWLFEDEDGILPTKEHQDQIIALNEDASFYLFKYEKEVMLGKFYADLNGHFKEVKEFRYGINMDKELKKWLYNLGIPFKNKTYFSFDHNKSFILNWKMIIKYCADLFFGRDLCIWDKTLNWVLFYDHNDVFYFGKGRIYTAEIEGQKMIKNKELFDDWVRRSKMITTE